MTTLSMNAGQLVPFRLRAPNRSVQEPVVRDAASSLAIKAHARRALGIAGRFALALIPFSTLSWIFIAN